MKRKLCIVTAVAILTSLSLTAQIRKGSLWMSGQAGFSWQRIPSPEFSFSISSSGSSSSGGIVVGGTSPFPGGISPGTIRLEPMAQKTDTQEVQMFTFQPTIGYTLSDKWAIGLGVGVAKLRSSEGAPYQATLWSVSPFVRYYVPISKEKLRVFMQSSVKIGFSKSQHSYPLFLAGQLMTHPSQITGTDTYNYTLAEIALSPGIAYFPTSHWNIELFLRGGYMQRLKSSSQSKATLHYSSNRNVLTPTLGIGYFF